MVKSPLFVGNWKMNFLPAEADKYLSAFLEQLDDAILQKAEVALAVPFPLIPQIAKGLQDSSIKVASQNVHWEESGAHTGEVSIPLLKAFSVSYSLVGHSERRQFYGENDVAVAKRTQAASAAGITPVLCVGESEQEYRSGKSQEVTRSQLQAGIAQLSAKDTAQLVIAYEPVWAIGTGLAATPEHAESQHAVIREALISKFSDAGTTVPILYGGSTKPENIAELISVPNVDGALPGGSSLKPEVFASLIKTGCEAFYKAQ